MENNKDIIPTNTIGIVEKRRGRPKKNNNINDVSYCDGGEEGAAMVVAEKKQRAAYYSYIDAVGDGAELIAWTLKKLNKNKKKNKMLSMLDIKNLSFGLGIIQDKINVYKNKNIGHYDKLDATGVKVKLEEIKKTIEITCEK